MTDVLIVGGAVMGSSIAYHLAGLDPSLDVVVLERDPSYARSSTVLSDGNVRVQFNLDENVQISQYALDALTTFADDMAVGDHRPDPGARHQGNLFLADEATRQAARDGLAVQRALGCDEVEWLDRNEIVRRWPVVDGPHFVGGTFGPRDGSVDPSAVLHGFRRKAAALGVAYRQEEVTGLLQEGDRVGGAVTASGGRVRAATTVVAAGAWSTELLATAGIDIPVQPVMRNVFVVATDLGWEGELPSVFLPSGLYILPEHEGTFLVAWSQEDDPVGFDFTVRRSRFYDLIWPELVEQFPRFDRLDIVRSWAGLYAVNTMDGNALIGPWPGVDGLQMCTGFSGHGFQQAFAVGRHLAEEITGRQPTLDLRRLAPDRVVRNEPLYEHEGRII